MFGPLALKFMITSPDASTAIEPLNVATFWPMVLPDIVPCATTTGLAGLLTSILNQWTLGTLDPGDWISFVP